MIILCVRLQLAHQAGIPKGVLNVVSCSRPNAAGIGKLFCEDPKVATVSFTGSCEVGKVCTVDSDAELKVKALSICWFSLSHWGIDSLRHCIRDTHFEIFYNVFSKSSELVHAHFDHCACLESYRKRLM